MSKRPYGAVGIALLTLVGGVLSGAACSKTVEKSAPSPAAAEVKTSGGRSQKTSSGAAGVGWSTAANTEEATKIALKNAGVDDADITFVYYTPQHDPKRIVATIRDREHPQRRLIGQSSHHGILTAEGYHTSPEGVVGVMAMKSRDLVIGIAAVGFDEVPKDHEGEAAKLAYRRAVADAKKDIHEAPSMVLITPTNGGEEKVLQALADEVGPDVPLLGGTAAGPSREIVLAGTKGEGWSLVNNDTVLVNGVSVAVFYSRKSFGWAYGGGFGRASDKGGIITDSTPRLIRTINNRPALDVYDEWLGGAAKQALARGENMMDFCALHPLIRAIKSKHGTTEADVSHSQFVHPRPNPDQETDPGSLIVGANVANGDSIYMSEGSWNILLNRFSQLPMQARTESGMQDPSAGLFIYCGGALDTIPYDNRANMGYLVSKSIGDVPWIANFSWGEQGHVRGVGNLHGNEMAGTILFP